MSLSVSLLGSPRPEDSREFFELRIRPILANNCYACHTSSKLGDLQVDSREHLLKGGKSGPAIVPGKPEESLLIRAVRHDDSRLKMPLGGKLADQEISDLVTWVASGAPWPDDNRPPDVAAQKSTFVIRPQQRKFWAFQPLRRPTLPAVKDVQWIKSPIDRFVLSQLEAHKLTPVDEANKRTLIRRATFDLTGLPPTAEEVEAFLNAVRDGKESPISFESIYYTSLATFKVLDSLYTGMPQTL